MCTASRWTLQTEEHLRYCKTEHWGLSIEATEDCKGLAEPCLIRTGECNACVCSQLVTEETFSYLIRRSLAWVHHLPCMLTTNWIVFETAWLMCHTLMGTSCRSTLCLPFLLQTSKTKCQLWAMHEYSCCKKAGGWYAWLFLAYTDLSSVSSNFITRKRQVLFASRLCYFSWAPSLSSQAIKPAWADWSSSS